MNNATISKILIVLLTLISCFAPAGFAGMGTGFTYQGRLIDANKAADGLYDFQFKLYDAEIGTIQLGSEVNKPDVDVMDGYFTVNLDFGSVFDGNDRWLDIGVRAGELEDPNTYTSLSPRQKVTPTPYAVYAESAGNGGPDTDWIISGSNMYSGVSGNVGIGTSTPAAKLEIWGSTDLGAQFRSIRTGGATAMFGGGQFEGVAGTYSDHPFMISTNNKERLRVDTSGNVGIGTSSPGTKLDVAGVINAADYYHLNGKALAYNPDGTGNFYYGWDVTVQKHILATAGVERLVIDNSGNVGVGTTTPSTKLEVAGQVKITGGSPGAGKLLTSDEAGLASWQNPPAGDNLGNHIATDNIQLNDNWLSGDGDNEGVFVAGNGNVGIGTDNPTRKFHVSQSSTGNPVAKIENTATTNSLGLSIETGSSDSSSALRVVSDGTITFYVNNNGKVEVPANDFLVQGSVGIGTFTPARKLHVRDVMRLEPRASAPSSPAEGDIYMDSTTHKLMVYDGTTWRACW
jgi:hypothetical protein